tara:strand:- start:252 stop:488 length:237 start_codon:yes stop_codon:yes gene_type:complete
MRRVVYLDGVEYTGKDYDDVLGRVIASPFTGTMTPEHYMNHTAALLKALGKTGDGHIDTSSAEGFFRSLLALGLLKTK